jgi:hypothetical protein
MQAGPMCCTADALAHDEEPAHALPDRMGNVVSPQRLVALKNR